MKCVVLGHETIGAIIEERLEAAGYEVVAEVGDADTVLTYYTSQTQLEDALFDDEGVLKQAKKGALLIDLSAATPSFARELAALALASELSVVEAPITVIDPCSEDALTARENLACFFSGDADAKKRAAVVLEAIFSSVQDMGDIGAASMARAAYSIQFASALVAAVEADALYRAVRMMPAGLDQAATGSAGSLLPAGDTLLAAVEAGRFDGPFTVEMLMGDISAALSTAEDAELALPQTAGIMNLLEALALIGGAGKSLSALALAYRDTEDAKEEGLDWSRLDAYGEQPEQEPLPIRDGLGRFVTDDEEDDYWNDVDDWDTSDPAGQKTAAKSDPDDDYGFEDDDPGYGYDDERYEEYADFEDDFE